MPLAGSTPSGHLDALPSAGPADCIDLPARGRAAPPRCTVISEVRSSHMTSIIGRASLSASVATYAMCGSSATCVAGACGAGTSAGYRRTPITSAESATAVAATDQPRQNERRCPTSAVRPSRPVRVARDGRPRRAGEREPSIASQDRRRRARLQARVRRARRGACATFRWRDGSTDRAAQCARSAAASRAQHAERVLGWRGGRGPDGRADSSRASEAGLELFEAAPDPRFHGTERCSSPRLLHDGSGRAEAQARQPWRWFGSSRPDARAQLARFLAHQGLFGGTGFVRRQGCRPTLRSIPSGRPAPPAFCRRSSRAHGCARSPSSRSSARKGSPQVARQREMLTNASCRTSSALAPDQYRSARPNPA